MQYIDMNICEKAPFYRVVYSIFELQRLCNQKSHILCMPILLLQQNDSISHLQQAFQS